MIAHIKRAEEFADLIEVRFDCLESGSIKNCLENLPIIEKTYLFTFRSKEQGGKREISLREKLKFWELVFCVKRSDFMIDIEFDPKIMLVIDPPKTQRIVSYHDFEGTPDNLDFSWSAMSELSNGVVKIAVQTDDITDSIELWKLLDQDRKSVV